MALQLFKEPLVGFFLAGAIIFAASALIVREDDTRTIAVTNAQINRIAEQWQMQMGRAPSPQQMSGLLEDWIREEIYYREARRRGLQDNDAIIRRRLVQKLTFLTEDLAESAPPSDTELQAFYDTHRGEYTHPPRITFEHRYFSNDRRQDARADALAALSETASEDPGGDPFILQRSYAARSEQEIGDLFGRDFATALRAFEVSDSWQGPVSSAYGWHLIRLSERQPAQQLSLDEVRSRVQSDLQRYRREAANETLYAQLRASYQIDFPETTQ